MANNIFSRPFVTLGIPRFDTGGSFDKDFEAGDQVWYHLADGRVIKETGITGIPNAPTGFGNSDSIRVDYRNQDGISKQTWLKVDDARDGQPPKDFDGKPYTDVIFDHCYDPLADTMVSLSNGRDSSISLSPPTVPSMSAQFHFPQASNGFWHTIINPTSDENPWRVNNRCQLWVATAAGCKLMFTGLVTDPSIEFRETHFWISLHATGWSSRLTQFAHYNSPNIKIPVDEFTIGDALIEVARTAEGQILGKRYIQDYVLDLPGDPASGTSLAWVDANAPLGPHGYPEEVVPGLFLLKSTKKKNNPLEPSIVGFETEQWDTPIAFWWAGSEAPWHAIQKLVATQGPPASYYEDPTGRLVMFNGDPENRDVNDIVIGPEDGELHPIASISIGDHIADIANYASVSVDLRGFQGTTAQNVRPVLLRKDSIPGVVLPDILTGIYVWADKLTSILNIPSLFPFKPGQGLEPDTPPPGISPQTTANAGDTRVDSQKPQQHVSYEQPQAELTLASGDIELSGTLVIGNAQTGSAGNHSHAGGSGAGSHRHGLPTRLPINASATMTNLVLTVQPKNINVGQNLDGTDIQRDPSNPDSPAVTEHDHGIIERPTEAEIEAELLDAQVKPAEMYDWHFAPVALLWDNIMENFHLSGQHGADRGYVLPPEGSRYFHIQLGQPWVFGGMTIGDDGIQLQRDFSWKDNSPTGRYSFDADVFIDNAEVEVTFTKLNGVGAEIRVTNRSTTDPVAIPTLAIWGYPLTTFHTSEFWHSPEVRDDPKTKASVRRYGQQTYGYQGLRSIYTDLAQKYADHCVKLYRDGVRTFQVRLYGQQNGEDRTKQSTCLDLAPGQLLTKVTISPYGPGGPGSGRVLRAGRPDIGEPAVRSVHHSWQHGHHFIDLVIDELPEQAAEGYPWKQLNP